MTIPENLEALLRRRELAIALTAAGFPTAEATLATKATRGGGPPFRLYGRIPIYRWGDGLDWARSRLSELVWSTSERDASATIHPAESAALAGPTSTPEPAPTLPLQDSSRQPTPTAPKPPISPQARCSARGPRAVVTAAPSTAAAVSEENATAAIADS
jgi:hypothetical protein